MKIETIEKLCCPFDKSDLDLTIIAQDITGNIQEGLLVCSQCNHVYPIVKGIPIMSPDEYREFALEQPLLEQWKQHFSGKRLDGFRLVEASQDEIAAT